MAASTTRPISPNHWVRLLPGLLILLAWCIPLEAQSRDRGPIVLELPASTRALALGNSFALGFRDSDAVFYQPGLLNQASGFSGSIQRYGSASTLISLSAGGTWLDGGVALGVQHLSYGAATEGTLGGGAPYLSADVGSLRTNGSTGVSELVVSAGYGRTFKGLQVGIVGKLTEQRFGPNKSATGAVDLGISTSQGPVTLGVAVQNLGPDLSFFDEEVPLPLGLGLGISTERAPVGPLDVGASGALNYRIDGDLVPSAGLEVAYWPVTGRTFIGRIGFRHLPKEQSAWPVTFGGAFMGDDIILEYAYEGFDSGSGAHRFSVGWR
ncbi:MAG: hypothetical protein PVJ76_07920 [Gemmatimonadota bacterium]